MFSDRVVVITGGATKLMIYHEWTLNEQTKEQTILKGLSFSLLHGCSLFVVNDSG